MSWSIYLRDKSIITKFYELVKKNYFDFGEDKLKRINENDNNKFHRCYEKGISLCVIDTSQQKYFKPNSSKKYLEIICKIIDEKSTPEL